MTTKGTDNRFRSLTVVGEPGTPSTPASGDFKLYVADDGTFYVMDDTGTPTAVGGGGFSDPMTTRGDIIVRNASNVTARLGVGGAGSVLSSDGTDVSWQAPASSGALVLIEQHTANNTSPNLDFTSFISSTYDEYLFEFLNVIPATNNITFGWRAGTGGGPTYDTGSNYDSVTFYAYPSSSGLAGSTGTGQTSYQISDSVANNSNYGINGSMRLLAPQSAIYKPLVGDLVLQHQSVGLFRITTSGLYKSSTALTAVRWFMSSGNIASGTIRVYGVAK